MLLMAALEFSLLALAAMLAPHLRFQEWTLVTQLEGSPLWLKALVFALINLVALASVGCYRHGLRTRAHEVLLRIVGAFILSGVVLGFVYYIGPDLMLGRGTLLIAFAVALALLMASRLWVVPLLDLQAFARRVLVIGAGEVASTFSRLRRRSDRRGFVITGYVAWPEQGVKVNPGEVIELHGSLHDYARDHGIDDIVIALDDQRSTLPAAELIRCKLAGMQVLDVAHFFERESGLLKLDILRPSSLVFSRHFRRTWYRDVTKRALDLVASAGLFVVTLPLLAIATAGILLESRGRGGIIFRQTRVGQGGHPFTLYKFRTMVEDAERDGVARWAAANDPRVTPFGALLRKYRIDELPQLLNVLRGDMSFVGPRPERPEFVSVLREKLPWYDWRHAVKPGLTGWAQIQYPYGASEQDAFEKLQYDLYYVKHQNFALDTVIMMQTVEVVLWRRGSR